ncbi:ABC transporter ATP-binding protein [Ornithinimicrobium sp. F0845]|uniref:ATP-binding cassette domain-containing protein n=1 Tax=Ornithinimicrobium sp. F0845 TaxID=2926412 RepID=UPI001FF6D465|nr:ABC transporter ATP-binding protein [Ornithinimicrobium sp. F0845]MCK0110622.1 ABC transporter ATP-binding protein [Ornithinimicrobium sp. F0845]
MMNAAQPPDPPRTVVLAEGLALTTERDAVFGPIDLSIDAGEITLLVGPAGSGRSTLLLALTGRMKGLTGVLVVDHRHLDRSRSVRDITSVARISGLIGLEEQLTVGECIVERCLMDGVPTGQGSDRMALLAGRLRLLLDHATLVTDLTPLDQTLLAVALACLRRTELVVLDDLDAGLRRDEQREVLRRLERLTEDGLSVVASCLEDPSGGRYPVIELPAAPHGEDLT